MKYLSLDLETTGTDPKTCQILSIGIVLEDTENQLPIDELPCIYKEVYPKDGVITGQPYALDMNKDIISRMKSGKTDDMIYESQISDLIWDFIYYNDYDENLLKNKFFGRGVKEKNQEYLLFVPMSNKYKPTLRLAGKNVGTFDLQFLNKVPRFHDYFEVNYRILDPTNYYIQKEDEWLPNSQQCFDRAGLKKQVTHNALEDAKDTIKLLRKKYHLWEQ